GHAKPADVGEVAQELEQRRGGALVREHLLQRHGPSLLSPVSCLLRCGRGESTLFHDTLTSVVSLAIATESATRETAFPANCEGRNGDAEGRGQPGARRGSVHRSGGHRGRAVLLQPHAGERELSTPGAADPKFVAAAAVPFARMLSQQ